MGTSRLFWTTLTIALLFGTSFGKSSDRHTCLHREFDRVQDEIEWLKNHHEGFRMVDKVELKMGHNEFGDSIPELYYSAFGKEGTTLLYVPESSMFCYGTLKDGDLSSIFDDAPALLSPKNRVTLTILLMHEKYKSETSAFAPLLNNLPWDLYTPLLYSTAELNVINGTFAERRTREFLPYLQEVWNDYIVPELIGHYDPEDRVFARGAPEITFEMFLQASALVQAFGVSLSHGGVSQVAIVPVYHWLKFEARKTGIIAANHQSSYSIPGLELVLMKDLTRSPDKEVYARQKISAPALFSEKGIRYEKARAKVGVAIWFGAYADGELYHLTKERLNAKLIEFIRQAIWRAVHHTEDNNNDQSSTSSDEESFPDEWPAQVKLKAYEHLKDGLRQLYMRFTDDTLRDVRHSIPQMPRWQAKMMVQQRDQEKGIVMRNMQMLDTEIRLLERKYTDEELRPSVAPTAAPTGRPLEEGDMEEPVLPPGELPRLDLKYRRDL